MNCCFVTLPASLKWSVLGDRLCVWILYRYRSGLSNRLDIALQSRYAGTILGQGGPAGANGSGLHWLLFGTPPSIGTYLASRHLFETFSLQSLAGPIFHTAMQIALSSNHSLLVCIPHLKSHLCSPCSPK